MKDDIAIEESSRGPRRTVRSHWKALLIPCLALWLVIHLTSSSSSPSTHLKAWFPHSRNATCSHSHEITSSGAVKYMGETIAWKPCGDIAGRTLECSELDVPMDQFNATNSGTKTFSIPLTRLRGKDGSQNLLLNPGGPGGSGTEFVYRRGKQLAEIVGDGFHLLGFDPRGINMSRPLASCYATAEARKDLAGVKDDEIVHDSPEIFAWARNFVRACDDTMSEYGGYLNTPQTAADMNSILDAVGQKDLVYWGFSYGTILGQTYASLFPERSRRVIIDGVANNFNWYGSDFDTEQFTDTEHVLNGFFDECIKAGENCTLTRLANTKEKLSDLVFDLLDQIREQPLSVYVNSTVYGLLDYPSLLYGGIFPVLYSPSRWYSLASNLANLLQGNATSAWYAYGRQDPWGLTGEANAFIIHNDALTGPNHYPQDRDALLDLILPFANASLFAPTANSDFYTRAQWTVPRTHNFSQHHGIQTAHPLLILSTSFDPICPLVSARAANKAFKHSRLVEVLGYGHCSVAVASTCLVKYVRAFLYNGTLPDGNVQCEVDGAYFPVPEEDGRVVAQRAFETLEEERVHLAQLELARDWSWRVGRAGLPMPM